MGETVTTPAKTEDKPLEKGQEPTKPRTQKIKKRDGRIVDFELEKIAEAIFYAARAVGGRNRSLAKELADGVQEKLTAQVAQKGEKHVPTVEDVQDMVEITLIEKGHASTAKSFILYRQKKREERQAKSALLGGKQVSTKIDINGLKLLEKRYLAKDGKGMVTETPDLLFQRVAKAIASADKKYEKTPEQIKETQEKFHQMMRKLDFLPSTPILMNGGTKQQQLYSSFVIGIGDSVDSIFDGVKKAAVIHHGGGGTGFCFSSLRPKGDSISSSTGTTTGPISFMKVFDAATQHIKQGGRRRGANMAILRVDHPDILEFINLKADGKTMTNFNISVALTNKFMRAVKSDWDIELVNPRTQEVVKKVSSKSLFDNMVTMAWKRGDPGIVFIDRINESNPTPTLGRLQSTSPCADQHLLAFEGSVLGSINLTRFFKAPETEVEVKTEEKINWNKLSEVVHLAVHFLDNAIDVNQFTSAKIKEATLRTRKIGLGVMGFADLLFQLELQYNSDEAVAIGEKIMKFINQEAQSASAKLATQRGVFPAWKESIYATEKKKLRNASITCVSPTGSISIIAGVSASLEPNFALCYRTKVLESEMIKVNPVLEKKLEDEKLLTPILLAEIAKRGVQGADLPRKFKKLFVTTTDISPEYHIKMQAAFQKHCDGGVSKTINFPSDCSIEDVRKAYLLVWDLGCKGVTIYRDTSLDGQVIEKLS